MALPDTSVVTDFIQAQLFEHRCTIHRPVEGSGGLGDHTAPTDSVAATAVSCYFETGKSQQGLTLFVRDEVDNLFTLDTVHFNVSVDLQISDVLEQTTGPDAGRYWAVQGNDQSRNELANKLIVLASRVPQKPDWVT